MVAQMAASNAVLQTIVEEEKRGRVMSFYTMAFFGMGPLGSLLAGGLAGTIGILPTFLTFGDDLPRRLGWSLRRCLPSLRRAIRPMYVRAGLLSDLNETAEPEVMSIGDPSLEAARPRRLAA